MRFNVDEVMRRINEIYAERKDGPWDGFKAPEQRPRIQSEGLRVVVEVLVGMLNEMAAES